MRSLNKKLFSAYKALSIVTAIGMLLHASIFMLLITAIFYFNRMIVFVVRTFSLLTKRSFTMSIFLILA